MGCNVGKKDKIVRFLVGAVILVIGHEGGGDLLKWLGLVVWLTGYFEFCGLYKVLGINTCEKSDR